MDSYVPTVVQFQVDAMLKNYIKLFVTNTVERGIFLQGKKKNSVKKKNEQKT